MREKYAMMRGIVLFLMFLFGFGQTVEAQSCSASYTSMNFGVVDLTTNGAYPTAATHTVTCSGSSGQVIYICGGASIAGPYSMGPVGFSLFQDSGGSAPWTGSGSVTIGPNGTAALSQTVFGRRRVPGRGVRDGAAAWRGRSP